MSGVLLTATVGASTYVYLVTGFDSAANVVRSSQVSTTLAAAVNSGDNTTYLGSNARTGFDAAETAITTVTARSLAEAWSTPSQGNSFVSSQVMTSAGVAFWGDQEGYEHATDVVTGHQVWLSPQLGVLQQSQVSCQGGYAPVGINGSATAGQIGTQNVVYVADGLANEYALDASTGAIVWKTNLAPVNQEVFGSPALYNGSLYVGLSSNQDCPLTQGQLIKLDAATGAVQATFALVPTGCTGGGVWSSPTIDEADNAVYIATGNAGSCLSAEPYAQSIVKLRADTLAYVSSWQQTDTRSLDHDFGATPTLFTATVSGVARQLVGAVNKNGIFYALDRTNLSAGPVWSFQVSAAGNSPELGNGSIAPASFDGSTLYIGGGKLGSCAAELSALNPATGVPLWRDCTEGPIIGGVVTAPGLVVAGAGQYVNVFDAATGAKLLHWSDGNPAWYFTAPTVSNGWILIPKSAGILDALTVLPPPPVALAAEATDAQLLAQAPQLGAGWHSLGGRIVAVPAVAAAPNPRGATPSDPLFIGTGADQRLWIRSVTAGWQPVGGARCIGGPAAVISGTPPSGPFTLTLACRGTDNALWENSTALPSSGLPQFTQPWTSLGGVLSAGPAAAAVGNTMTFFVLGTDGAVYTRTPTTGYSPTPWRCIGSPAVAQQAADGVTTFVCLGTDRALWEATNAGGWSPTVSLGGALIGGPAVAATSQETDVLAEGTDRAVWEDTPGGWSSLGGTVVGGVSAAALN